MSDQAYKNFWNEKILPWEKIYTSRKLNSIISRKQIALSLLINSINNLRVLEIGCGSGRLAYDLRKSNLKSYHGIDISDVAIAAAKNRLVPYLQENRFTFKTQSIFEINPDNYDCIISLGLVDWLTYEELMHLFKISENKKFLHSFSSTRKIFQRLIHKIYVATKYGVKTNFWPKYYSDQFMLSHLKKSSDTTIHNQNNSFGSFIYNL